MAQDPARQTRRQHLGHQAKTPPLVTAHRHQRSTKGRHRIGRRVTGGIECPTFRDLLACGFGHGDLAQSDRGGGLVELQSQPAFAVRHGKGDRVCPDHTRLAARRGHNRRGVGKSDADQPCLGDLLGEISKRGAGVCVSNGQTGQPELAGRIERRRKPVCECGLSKPHLRIHMDRCGARYAHHRCHVAFDAAAGQLQAIAFQVVQAANPVSCGFGPRHRPCHLGRGKGTCPVSQQCRLNCLFNLILCDARHMYFSRRTWP